eukprot:scaffold340464_cov18-Prasinocladus_malaysianus.AAC.1
MHANVIIKHVRFRGSNGKCPKVSITELLREMHRYVAQHTCILTTNTPQKWPSEQKQLMDN